MILKTILIRQVKKFILILKKVLILIQPFQLMIGQDPLKIQDGCNYGCSFCTIPLARGRSRSNTIKYFKNIKEISDRDVKEIVLTGINIGDFGIQNGRRKEKLINLLHEIENLKLK